MPGRAAVVSREHRVVVIGSGFGGLFAVRAMRRATDLDITLIDRQPSHLFQPLLYQVATGILSEGEIAPSTRNILRKQRNVRTLLGQVDRIDVESRTVTSTALGIETVTPYDSLIVAAGAYTGYFGKPEFAKYAPGLKSIDDALDIRTRIFSAFEAAELETDAARRAEWLTFVIVGAGATGVEMAGQIAELSGRTLRRDFRAVDPTSARIVLIDGAPEPLPAFGNRLSEAAARKLTDLGVEIWLDTLVTDVDETGIEVKDSHGTTTRIASRTKVWSAGVTASELGRQLSEQTGAAVGKGGRIAVNPDLTLPGRPEIFVVGDMIDLDNLPGVSPVAIQTGRYAADAIERRVRGSAPPGPFKYFDKGSMATISRFSAVASIGPIRLRGFLAWLLWLGVHLFYLVGFKNRVTTVFHWAVSFVGRSRSERASARETAHGGSLIAQDRPDGTGQG